MSQMSPIGWLCLFIIFSIMFILFSMMNCYLTIPKSPKSKILSKNLISAMNWKC